MNTKAAFLFSALFVCAFFFPSIVQANNLSITNVRMGGRDPNTKKLSVVFDIAWENSWRNKINHDAAWVTVRLNDADASPVDKRLCSLSVAGLDPVGTSAGTSEGFEIYIPQDKVGAFIRRSTHSEAAAVSLKDVKLTIDYSNCGLPDAAKIAVSLLGLEMVLVPEGSFYAGDFSTSTAAFRRGSADNDPWPIASNGAISVTGTASAAYYYVSAGNADEVATGSSFVVAAAFPKGFSSFYVMKYEITEGQWVEFLNSLPSATARAQHDLTDTMHKNSDTVVSRNTISCLGSPLVCSTQRAFRPVTYLAWKDLVAFLDWAGLRPMTELEFEKAARGPFVPLKGDYAWGATVITAASVVSGAAEEGIEVVDNTGANAIFGLTALSGGDAASGPEYQSGPLRSGVFATESSNRELSGAGNFGAMELSGNVKEWVVTIGNSAGLLFTGLHGDGLLTTVSGFEGNANVSDWPGMDAESAHGVTGAAGTGFRGGSWADVSERLRISDRQEAAGGAADAQATYGGRGVRTFDGE